MLDPQRIGLNAASVGFLVRTGQNVDWSSFNQALQTDDSRTSVVTRTIQTPVDELHVMGGQRFGLEGNSNLKMNARQERQMNGYPLRSFSAEAPAIILPDKYGGLPLYTRNQTEYSDFVSSYTAPLSMALQNDTVLLSRQGYSVSNESASQPFKDVGFEHNMHKSRAAIDYNTAAIQQRQWLQHQSQVARKQKQGGKVTQMRMNSNNGRGVRNAVDGIFISANGDPMSFVNDESLGDAFYDATIHPDIPAQNILIPGPGGQVQPSADFLSYNSFNQRPYSNQTPEEDERELMRRHDIRRGRVLDYSPSIESAVSQRILATSFSTPAPRDPRARNTETDIDEDPLSNQAATLKSSAFVPSGMQAMALLDDVLARVDRAKTISSRGDLNDPDLIIARTPQGFPMRNRHRESFSGADASGSDRTNLTRSFAFLDARARRREKKKGKK
jgi:hypothetical protein